MVVRKGMTKIRRWMRRVKNQAEEMWQKERTRRRRQEEGMTEVVGDGRQINICTAM